MTSAAKAVRTRAPDDRGEDAQRLTRRAERHAVALSLLQHPPDLSGLGPGRAEDVSGEVLRPSRSRPVVRWSFTWTPAGSRPLRMTAIGKGYLKGGAAHQHALLTQLRRGGLVGETAVPMPYGLDVDRALLVQEEAPAGTLHDLLGTPAAVPAAVLAGAWLARCHALTASGVAALPDEHVPSRTAAQSAAVLAAVPAATPLLRPLCARALLAARPEPLVLTHGDFQPKNVHTHPGRLVVIDLDRAALAPAARDLGSFLVQTWTMTASATGEGGRAAPVLEAFLRSYEDSREAVAPASLAAHVAVALLEVLYYRLVVRPVPDPLPCLSWVGSLSPWWQP